MDAAKQAVRAELNKILDPNGDMKKMANRLALMLLREPDADLAYSALVAAAALFLSEPDPEITKENAVQMARDLGDHIAGEVEEGFEVFVANRRKAGL